MLESGLRYSSEHLREMDLGTADRSIAAVVSVVVVGEGEEPTSGCTERHSRREEHGECIVSPWFRPQRASR